MSQANVSLGNVNGLGDDLRIAQESINLPEVQEMLRKLAKFNLGICLPHILALAQPKMVLSFWESLRGILMSFATARRVLRGAVVVFAAVAAMAIAGGTQAQADQAFNNPQISGVIVDHCAVWANNCGWGGAHQFCQTQGFAAARSFQVFNPGRTYVIGSQQVCEGGYCVGFSQVVCIKEQSSTSGSTFNHPQVNGAAVDNCETWATNCGKGGADAFCRTQGYGGALSFQLYNPGRTWVIGSQQYCEGGYCVGLSQVVCGAAAPPPPPTAVDVLSGSWVGYHPNYEFRQSGSTFTWWVESTQERAQGTINGVSLSVNWGAGSATGTITAWDASGRATRIEWSNGSVFTRK